jgi:hypothetical protein
VISFVLLLATSAMAQDGGVTEVVPLSIEDARTAILKAVPLLTMEQVAWSLPDSTLGARLQKFYAEEQPGLDFSFRFSPGGFAGDAPLSLGYHEKTASLALKRWVTLPDAKRSRDLHLSSRALKPMTSTRVCVSSTASK